MAGRTHQDSRTDGAYAPASGRPGSNYSGGPRQLWLCVCGQRAVMDVAALLQFQANGLLENTWLRPDNQSSV